MDHEADSLQVLRYTSYKTCLEHRIGPTSAGGASRGILLCCTRTYEEYTAAVDTEYYVEIVKLSTFRSSTVWQCAYRTYYLGTIWFFFEILEEPLIESRQTEQLLVLRSRSWKRQQRPWRVGWYCESVEVLHTAAAVVAGSERGGLRLFSRARAILLTGCPANFIFLSLSSFICYPQQRCCLSGIISFFYPLPQRDSYNFFHKVPQNPAGYNRRGYTRPETACASSPTQPTAGDWKTSF